MLNLFEGILEFILHKYLDVEANLLPSMLSSLDGAVINNNFALQAGMNLNNSLFVEDEHSQYVNIVVVRESEGNYAKFATLKKWITSQKVKDFIAEKDIRYSNSCMLIVGF